MWVTFTGSSEPNSDGVEAELITPSLRPPTMNENTDRDGRFDDNTSSDHRVIRLAGGKHVGTHRLATTAHGDGILDDPMAPALPDIRVIRAVKLQQTAIVR